MKKLKFIVFLIGFLIFFSSCINKDVVKESMDNEYCKEIMINTSIDRAQIQEVHDRNNIANEKNAGDIQINNHSEQYNGKYRMSNLTRQLLIKKTELLQYIGNNEAGLAEEDFSDIDIDDFIEYMSITHISIQNYGIGQLLDNYKNRMTEQELLQYIKKNETGLTEEDFSDIEIVDFIRSRLIKNNESGFRWLNRNTLDRYQQELINFSNKQMLAYEIRSVNSTDEEYRVFVEAFLNAIDGETVFQRTHPDGRDEYIIINERGRRTIEIGRTKNISQYNISVSLDVLEMFFIVNYSDGLGYTTNFCYSNDNKFFLIPSPRNSVGAYGYELCEIFTKMEYQ